MDRPTWDEYFLKIAKVVALRGSCVRRKVGAVLVSEDHRILSTGFNGRASGLINCEEQLCEGATMPSGMGLGKCEAIHAEQNALLYCSDVRLVHSCYTIISPCISCIKLLLGTACRRIVFLEEYSHNIESKNLWSQRKDSFWIHLQ